MKHSSFLSSLRIHPVKRKSIHGNTKFAESILPAKNMIRIHIFFSSAPLGSKVWIRVATALLILAISRYAEAQKSDFNSHVEIGVYASASDRLPFWLRVNQWGRVPLEAPTGIARLGFHFQTPRTYADTARHESRLSLAFGAEGVLNILPHRTQQYLLPEAYIKLNWKGLELMAGREYRTIGIVDTTLTSGSYSWSGNSLPIPMIRLSVEEYQPLSFLKNILSLKGSYAHGWFNVPYIKGAYLHQKTFYGRLGKPDGKVHFQLGLVHSVTWGGSADYLRDSPFAVNGKLTTNIGDYLRGVVLGKIPKDKMNNRFTIFDGTNRVGNHVGHFDMAVDWKIKKTNLLLYRQHPFEDASGLQFQNLPDGLYGASLRRYDPPLSSISIRGFLAEFLFTRNQSGPVFDPAARYQGRDDYFNHAQYRQGWSYRGHGMGTPFIPVGEEVRQEVGANREFFPTNQTKMYHIGLELLLAGKIHLLAKYSSSTNFGTYNVPFQTPIRQQSSLLSFDAPLLRWGNTRIKAQIAYDKGGLYSESLGGYLGFRSSFGKKQYQ